LESVSRRRKKGRYYFSSFFDVWGAFVHLPLLIATSYCNRFIEEQKIGQVKTSFTCGGGKRELEDSFIEES